MTFQRALGVTFATLGILLGVYLIAAVISMFIQGTSGGLFYH